MNAELLYDPPPSADPPAPGGDAHPVWQRMAFWPVLVLVASLVVTAVFWRNAQLEAVAELQRGFENQTYDLKNSLEAHLDAHALVLKGFEGLFNASNAVSRSDFQRYFETMQLGNQDSGFTAVAFHRMVAADKLPAHIASVRHEGFPEYHLQPPGARAVYAPLTYIEPMGAVNRMVLGFDPLTVEAERLAIERARDTAEVSISAKLILAQDAGSAVPGFVMYVPLYASAEALTTIEERRKAFIGWIDAPFHMKSLITHMFPLGFDGLDLEIFDGAKLDADSLLYDSDGPLSANLATASQLRMEKNIFFGSHQWTLIVRAQPSFGASEVRQRPQFVAGVGALLSTVLSLLTLALTRTAGRKASRAKRQAAEMLQREQRKQQEWLRLVLLASDAGTWEWNLRSKVNLWSDQLWRLHGDAEHRLGTTKALWKATVHPDDQRNVYSQVKEAASNGRKFELEYRAQVNGQERWYMSRGYPVINVDGVADRYLGIVLDVTARRQAEQSSRIAATAFESPEGKTITDAQGTILRVNQAFTQITGYSAEEAVGQNPRILKSGRQDDNYYTAMWDSLHTSGTWQGEIWNRRKSGEVYPEWLSISAVRSADGFVCNYVATFTDITQRKRAEDKIEHLASFDALTDLPNRRLMLDRLARAMLRSQRHARHGALMRIDMDGFKNINDTLGYAAGDHLLVEVAARLKLCIRDGDTVARLGSDEFVVILEDLDESEAAAVHAEGVARKILEQLSLPYCLKVVLDDTVQSHRNYICTASIGITLFRQQSLNCDELMIRADTAMHQAKKAGRNTLRFFDPDMQASVKARSELEADLRVAIDQGQLLLHYQPQVDSGNRVTGAEALVRWQHPQRGLVSPVEFIPLAEDTVLIVPLGDWVLKTACHQLAAWAESPATATLVLAVNVSAHQFSQSNFVDKLLSLIAQTGARPECLKLELTESLLLKNVKAVIATMHVLKAQGISFSLDDFGTGYSCLAYLKLLPLDQLKIDQSFVRDILTDPNDAAIARTVIALGQSMRLAVIAEGVETQGQRDFLESSGCHAYQGYFFSRPLPLMGFEEFFRSKLSPH
jgi:diguanylate cyclase (GGDEF)-like protein/PAS domain S-box-containing protein